MYFLGAFQDTLDKAFAKVGDTIGSLLLNLIRNLFYFLNEQIYKLLIWMYNMFDLLCNAQILSSDIVQSIATRIEVLLAVIMLFVVSVSLIRNLVDPDSMLDKTKGVGNIAKKVVIVIVMLGISNPVFQMLHTIQTLVIDGGLIPKIILPYDTDKMEDNEKQIQENFGSFLAAHLFTAFYDVDEDRWTYTGSAEEEFTEAQNSIYQLKYDILNNNDFSVGTDCIGYTFEATETGRTYFVIEYNFLLQTLFGGLIIFFIFSYILSVGVRVIQLAFLEIISPIAIIGYLSPSNDNMFSKWSKKYLGTYIDVFIRVALINFAVLLIALLFNTNGSAFDTFKNSVGWDNLSFAQGNFLKAIMVIAIFQFAKKAPELLKTILPGNLDSGIGFGINPKDTGLAMLGAATVGVGSRLIGGGAARVGHIRRNWNDENGNARSLRERAGLIAGGVAGTALGGVIGGIGGLHGGKIGDALKSSKTANEKFTQWSRAGGTNTPRRIASRIVGSVGLPTAGQQQQRNLEALQNYSKLKESMKSAADNYSFVDSLKQELENLKASNASADSIMRATEAYKQAQKAAIKYSLTGDENALNGIRMSEDDYRKLNNERDIYGSEIGTYMDEAHNIRRSNSNLFADGYTDDNSYDEFSNNADRAASQANTIIYDPNYRRAQANDAYNGNGGNK